MVPIEFDYSKLRGRMVEKHGSVSAVAKMLGISVAAMSSKLSNTSRIKTDEIYRLCQADCLDIPDEQIKNYFFTEKVR